MLASFCVAVLLKLARRFDGIRAEIRQCASCDALEPNQGELHKGQPDYLSGGRELAVLLRSRDSRDQGREVKEQTPVQLFEYGACR